jgi:hypothetical protein
MLPYGSNQTLRRAYHYYLTIVTDAAIVNYPDETCRWFTRSTLLCDKRIFTNMSFAK